MVAVDTERCFSFDSFGPAGALVQSRVKAPGSMRAEPRAVVRRLLSIVSWRVDTRALGPSSWIASTARCPHATGAVGPAARGA
jgi:hypothetical protein